MKFKILPHRNRKIIIFVLISWILFFLVASMREGASESSNKFIDHYRNVMAHEERINVLLTRWDDSKKEYVEILTNNTPYQNSYIKSQICGSTISLPVDSKAVTDAIAKDKSILVRNILDKVDCQLLYLEITQSNKFQFTPKYIFGWLWFKNNTAPRVIGWVKKLLQDVREDSIELNPILRQEIEKKAQELSTRLDLVEALIQGTSR